MTVHTVLFDAGLTLLTIAPSWIDVFRRGAEQAGIELPDTEDDLFARDVFRQHDRDWRATGRTSPHVGDDEAEAGFWRELYRRYLVALDVVGDHERATEVIYRAFQEPGVFVPFPEVDEVLDDLEARGVRTAIVSNWGPWLRDVLDHADLTSRFEVVVVSGEERVEKPDPAIFRVALEALSVEAGTGVAYVGDDLRADVEGSAAVGLRPVLVDRADRYPEHAGDRVRDLRELPDVLELPGRSGA